MPKPLIIDPTHHAVQLAQRDGFVCISCDKCTCCTPDRMNKECRPRNPTIDALFGGSHISGVRTSIPPQPPKGVNPQN